MDLFSGPQVGTMRVVHTEATGVLDVYWGPGNFSDNTTYILYLNIPLPTAQLVAKLGTGASQRSPRVFPATC